MEGELLDDDKYIVAFDGYPQVQLQPYTITASNGYLYYMGLEHQINSDGTRSLEVDGLRRTEVWPLLLENAWARVHSNASDPGEQLLQGYQQIGVGHSPGIVFNLFSSTDSFRIAKKDLSLAKLDDYFNNQQALIALVTYSNGEEKHPDAYAKGGKLVADHAYYVTEVNTTTREVTVRNPWGWNILPIYIKEAELPKFQEVVVNLGQ